MSTEKSRVEVAVAVLAILLVGIILGLGSVVIPGCSGRFEAAETNFVDSAVLGDGSPGDSATLDGRSDHEPEVLPEGNPGDVGSDASDSNVGSDASDSDVPVDARVDVDIDAYDPTYDITTCGYECAYTYDDNPGLEYPWCPRATHYLMNCCKPKNSTCVQHELLDYYFCCTD